MGRYEYVRFAVLVITFFMVALFGLTKVQAARSRRLPKMVCKAKQKSPASSSQVPLKKRFKALPLQSSHQKFRRRQQLLKRIQSLKHQTGVLSLSSQKHSIHYKNKHLKSLGGSKAIKERLRQRRLRMKYFRHHERPVTSYLYMHNLPRKAKRKTAPSRLTPSPHELKL